MKQFTWGGQHRPGPPKLNKIPPLGTSQVSACPHPSQPNRSAALAPSVTASPVRQSWQFFFLTSLCSLLTCLLGGSIPWPQRSRLLASNHTFLYAPRGGSAPWPQPSGLPASNSTLLHIPLTLQFCQAHIWLHIYLTWSDYESTRQFYSLTPRQRLLTKVLFKSVDKLQPLWEASLMIQW